jgi:hypothetical protein
MLAANSVGPVIGQNGEHQARKEASPFFDLRVTSRPRATMISANKPTITQSVLGYFDRSSLDTSGDGKNEAWVHQAVKLLI